MSAALREKPLQYTRLDVKITNGAMHKNTPQPKNKSTTEPQGSADEHAPIEQASGAPVRGAVPEQGGSLGLDPTRYGDWECNGRCIDF